MTGRLAIVAFCLLGILMPQQIAAEEPVALMYQIRAPYIVDNGDGTIRGLTADPSVLAFDRAGLDFKPVEIPTNRQLAMIRANMSAACGIGWFDRPDRRSFARFTSPVYRDRPTVALMLRKTAATVEDTSLEEMIANDALSLLIRTQFSYGAKIDSWIDAYQPDTTAVTLDNVGMARMIEAERADYMLLAEAEASHLLLEIGEDRAGKLEYLVMSDSPHGNYRHLMCSKSVPAAVIERLNAVIATFDLPK
ncbi:MAG: hypothetical protein RIM72_01815 [Alphaproteobacteria bacterium]